MKLFHRGQLIKTHPRQPPGGRCTDPADLPAERVGYAMRDLDRLRATARRHGQNIGIYADRLLDDPLPWTRMRAVYRLLGLVRRYGPGPVDTACGTALDLDVVVRQQDRRDARQSPGEHRPGAARRRRPPRRPVRPRPRRIHQPAPPADPHPSCTPPPPKEPPHDHHRHHQHATNPAADGPADPLGADLTGLLRTLKLSGMKDTLPERLSLARTRQLSHAAFLELLLSDEVSRRDARSARSGPQPPGCSR